MRKDFIIFIILVIILLVGGIYSVVKQGGESVGGEPIACTMDAMMCPDGSYVGRTGPNCEFVCPNQNTSTTPLNTPVFKGVVSKLIYSTANPPTAWRVYREFVEWFVLSPNLWDIDGVILYEKY